LPKPKAARAKAISEKGGAAAAVSALTAKAKLAGMWRARSQKFSMETALPPVRIVTDLLTGGSSRLRGEPWLSGGSGASLEWNAAVFV
jgi:hypothetical protein